MNKRKIAGFIIITILASFFIVNQMQNDTWEDTHWGGDVGEEEYSVPTQSEGTRDDGQLCSMVFVMGCIGGSGYYLHWKRKHEQ